MHVIYSCFIRLVDVLYRAIRLIPSLTVPQVNFATKVRTVSLQQRGEL